MKAIVLIIFSIVLSLVFSIKYDSTRIKLNQIISESSTQKDIKFYNLQIDEKEINQNLDLLIDSKTLNSKTIYESPIVMISTVNK
jgi:hypothetical protein